MNELMELVMGLLAVAILGFIYGGIPLLLLGLIPPAKARPGQGSHRDDMYGGRGSQPRHYEPYEAPTTSDSFESFSDNDHDTWTSGE